MEKRISVIIFMFLCFLFLALGTRELVLQVKDPCRSALMPYNEIIKQADIRDKGIKRGGQLLAHTNSIREEMSRLNEIHTQEITWENWALLHKLFNSYDGEIAILLDVDKSAKDAVIIDYGHGSITLIYEDNGNLWKMTIDDKIGFRKLYDDCGKYELIQVIGTSLRERDKKRIFL